MNPSINLKIKLSSIITIVSFLCISFGSLYLSKGVLIFFSISFVGGAITVLTLGLMHDVDAKIKYITMVEEYKVKPEINITGRWKATIKNINVHLIFNVADKTFTYTDDEESNDSHIEGECYLSGSTIQMSCNGKTLPFICKKTRYAAIELIQPNELKIYVSIDEYFILNKCL